MKAKSTVGHKGPHNTYTKRKRYSVPKSEVTESKELTPYRPFRFTVLDLALDDADRGQIIP